MGLRFKGYGHSDVGPIRQNNEDALYLGEANDALLAVVLDGMGGAASGRAAADLAVEMCATHFARRAKLCIEEYAAAWWEGEHPGGAAWSTVPTSDSAAVYAHVETLWKTGRPVTLGDAAALEAADAILLRLPVRALGAANRAILRRSKAESMWRGMGAAAVAAFFVGERVGVAHVGDSRVYRFRSGKLEQLTEDHSLLNECIRAGQLTTQEERDAFPHKNVIVRALGMKDDLKIDFAIHALAKGDVFLLCSDGLSNAVPEAELAELLSRPAEAASDALLQRALDLRTQDNVTLVVAEVQ